jgi:hypothetical protein
VWNNGTSDLIWNNGWNKGGTNASKPFLRAGFNGTSSGTNLEQMIKILFHEIFAVEQKID